MRVSVLAVPTDLEVVAADPVEAAILRRVLTLYYRWTTAARGTTVFCRERDHNEGPDGVSGGSTPRESGNSSQTAKNPPVTTR